MKILFLSGWGPLSVPLAMNCQESGHETKTWIQDKEGKDIGDGFVEKVDDYKSHVAWADLVISDYTRLGKINDSIRSRGIPVIGGTQMTDVMEDDRGMGQKLFKACGLDVLESKEFKSIEEAISYVQDNPKPYVVKVSGTAQDDKTTTYVGQMEDGSDVGPVLERMAEKMEKGVKGVEIQEKCEGIEVGISGFFNGEKFIGPCQVNFEHKALMPWKTQKGIGPLTGEMGTTAYWMDQDIGLFKKVLAPMVKPLKGMGYHGDFDINCIISEGKIYPLEMTNRFGWPTLPMQIEGLKENDLADFFMALATGKDYDLITGGAVSLCVVIGVPPLPYMNDDIFEKYSKDMPVLFRDGSAPEGLYPGEAKIIEGQWRVAGMSGCLAVAAACGHCLEDCSKEAYEIADQVVVPNRMIRDDIGRTTSNEYAELEEMGLLSAKEAVTL
jgi:phosphoribosylamine--glycine ligase